METFINSLSMLLILLSVLPFAKNQHWVFRVPEFMKLQILVLQIMVLILSFIFVEKNLCFWLISGVQILLTIYHVYILIRYTKFYKRKRLHRTKNSSETIKVISANVYQFNKDYQRFKNLIRKCNPDSFITIESNKDWEEANQIFEKDYPHTEKVTLENTYGMHFYSKIPFEKVTTHYFVADDLPSIEAIFKTKAGKKYQIFAVHPPPPSPTEETNCKERDGDLLSIAKKIKQTKIPSLVIGDFNTVAWSDTSILFRKTSELIDARVGRGILATFHAKHWFFRVPLDLLFHSPEIFIEKLETLEDIGSDHFPILCEFHLDLEDDKQEEEVKTLSHEEAEEVDELIEEGKKEESDNREEFAKE